MAWQPPASDAVDSGWQPPAGDAMPDQSAPPQSQAPNAGLQDTADTISHAMNFVNNPGGAPNANVMQPQGDALFNKAGGAVSEYLGSKFPNHPYAAAIPGTVVSMANPQNWMTTATAVPDKAQLPGAGVAEDMAQNAARRTLGYSKGMLKKPGALERANEVGQTMLDQNVIRNPLTSPLSFGAEDTYGRASDLADTSGQAIGKTIADLKGKPAIDTNAVGVEVSNQLSPKYSGGLYDTQKNIVGEILDTIGAHGNGPIDFSSAQALKQKLGEMAQFSKNTDALKADLYRRAYGIVNDALEKSVTSATAGVPAGASYLKNKQIYGASKEAEKALLNRMSSEAGNRRIGLTDTIAAGSELAAGHPGAAAGLVGLKHLAESAWNPFQARVMDYLARSGSVSKPEIQAAIAALIGFKTQEQK